MRHRYSPDQIEFLMAIVGVAFFAAFWFPLMDRSGGGWGRPFEALLASVPLVLLVTVLVIYRRRFRE